MQKQSKALSSPMLLVLFSGLFFISGTAGLIYEIVWERLLELYFGVTMISVTLIVAAYMGGLGIGSLLGGRLTRHIQKTLLVYGFLELGIGLFGFFSPALIIQVGKNTAGSTYQLVFLISFAILLIPTILMGMTLPLLTQSFIERIETSGQVIGLLYGINTLGAAFGAIISGFVLIGSFGFDGTINFAVAMNLFAGLGALALMPFQKRFSQPEASQKPAAPHASAQAWGYKAILFSSFLVGFIGLGYEMLWIRIIHIINKNTAYGFPSILFIFLLGLALGGYVFGQKADTHSNPMNLFWKIEIAAALVTAATFLIFLATLNFSPPWIQGFFKTQFPSQPYILIKATHEYFFSKSALFTNLWNYFLPILILVLPASFVLGGGLPVLDRIAITSPEIAGRRVGDIHLANIIGSVLGTLAISFVLLPYAGSEITLKILIGLSFVFPAIYLFYKKGMADFSRARSQAVILGILALTAILLIPGKGQFYNQLYEIGAEGKAIISESGSSVLALTYDKNGPQGKGYFWIGGEINSFFPPSGIYEQRAKTCAGASRPKRILVIGFGGGYSALFYKTIPDVKEIVIVELLEDIRPFLSDNLLSARATLQDARVNYIVDDGRRYLNAHPNEKFDLIALDPLREHTAGHNNLYSKEALEIYNSHLTDNGVLCAWMSEAHIIPHTFATIFPYVDQYENEFMIASKGPILYDTAYMNTVSAAYEQTAHTIFDEKLSFELQKQDSLVNFLRDQNQIVTDETNSPILTDLTPRLEYYFFTKPIKKDEIERDPAIIEAFRKRVR